MVDLTKNWKETFYEFYQILLKYHYQKNPKEGKKVITLFVPKSLFFLMENQRKFLNTKFKKSYIRNKENVTTGLFEEGEFYLAAAMITLNLEIDRNGKFLEKTGKHESFFKTESNKVEKIMELLAKEKENRTKKMKIHNNERLKERRRAFKAEYEWIKNQLAELERGR